MGWLILCVCLSGTQVDLIKPHSGCVHKGVLDELNIWIGRLCKVIVLPSVSGPHPICWRPEIPSLCLTVFKLGHQFSSALGLELHHWWDFPAFIITWVSLSLSLSLYIYIYMYIHHCVGSVSVENPNTRCFFQKNVFF